MDVLETVIRYKILPAITGCATPGDTERDLFALPAWLGGLGLINPAQESVCQYQNSVVMTAPLADLIVRQEPEYPLEVY